MKFQQNCPLRKVLALQLTSVIFVEWQKAQGFIFRSSCSDCPPERGFSDLDSELQPTVAKFSEAKPSV